MTTLAPPMGLCRRAAFIGACLIPVELAAAAGFAAEALPSAPVASPPEGAARESPQIPPGSSPAAPPAAVDAALARLTIASDSTCPSGPAVAEALAAIAPATEWPSGSVRIQTLTDMLVVELVSDGVTRRELRLTSDCRMRAMTVALVIATWTGELTSDAAAAPMLRGQGSKASAEAAAPASVPPVAARTASSHDGVAAKTTERELGAGLLLAVLGGIAPGIGLDFIQTRAPSGFGWQVDLRLPARRESSTTGISARWTRAALTVAGNGRLTLGRWSFSAHAGLAGGYTLTSGQGYAIDQGAQALTMGLVAGGRLGLGWRRVRVWTDVRVGRWLLPQVVVVDSVAGDRVATLELPSTDLQWSLGISYLFR
jgi:hypothetical protein